MKKNNLPDPSGPLSEQMPTAISSANVKVLKAQKKRKGNPVDHTYVDTCPEVQNW